MPGTAHSTGPSELWIISPEDKHLGTINPPKHPHNFAWGEADGETLYVLRLNIEGATSLTQEIHDRGFRGWARMKTKTSVSSAVN